ncbi:MAG: carboxypeptidase regulatory-like domain-containing protein [Thermodesulfobacteriota bacterium]
MKHLSQIALFLGAVLLFTGTAPAHKVNLFAYIDGQTVYTESYFPDGRPVEGGKVLVYDGQGELLVQGVTDAEGLFDFAAPKVDELRIVLEAGLGHRTEFTLSQRDLEAGG